MRRILLTSVVLAAFGYIAPANAQSMFEVTGLDQSCAVPDPAKAGRAFYVDPVAGSMKGNGSKARPWHTLAEVVDGGLIATAPDHWDPVRRVMVRANPNAPIKSGDTIYLLNGNHGSVTIQGWNGMDKGLAGFNNADFITIAALPGHDPVISRLNLKGGAKWIFRGLSFRSEKGPADRSQYYLVELWGPHENIVFENNRLMSAGDTSKWTMQDWYTRRASGISDIRGRCISIKNNTIRDVGYGIRTLASRYVLIGHNTIDRFADDGIDYGSDDLLIENNAITNSIEDGDQVHRDAMQGLPADTKVAVQNITIRNNRVIRVADSHLPFSGDLQGIDAFDGLWRNVTVSGNVVITNLWHGMAFLGTQNLSITDNIVLGDNGKSTQCHDLNSPDCSTDVALDHPGMHPWIGVFAGKDGMRPTDVLVRGNIAEAFTISEKSDRITFEKNACMPNRVACVISLPSNGKLAYFKKPGVYGDNVITGYGPDHWFVSFDADNAKYDLTIKDDPRGSGISR